MAEEKEVSTIKEAILSQAREDERRNSSSLSLKTILAGEFFNKESVREQRWVIVCILAFVVVYVALRYNIEQEMIRIDELKKELRNAKYRSIAVSSQLTEHCRETNVIRLLRVGPDSAIHVAEQPPYIIDVEE